MPTIKNTSALELFCSSKGLDMKLRTTFIPYATVGLIITAVMFFIFGDDRAKAFLVTYTIGYAATMVYLAGSRSSTRS